SGFVPIAIPTTILRQRKVHAGKLIQQSLFSDLSQFLLYRAAREHLVAKVRVPNGFAVTQPIPTLVVERHRTIFIERDASTQSESLNAFIHGCGEVAKQFALLFQVAFQRNSIQRAIHSLTISIPIVLSCT